MPNCGNGLLVLPSTDYILVFQNDFSIEHVFELELPGHVRSEKYVR